MVDTKTYEQSGRPYYHRKLASVAPIFFSKEKLPTGAGRCILSFSQPLQHATSENGSCAAVFGMLRCRSCTATLVFLQCGCHFGPKAALQQAKNCSATLKRLRCKKVALSCRSPVDFRLPRLGTHVEDLLISFGDPQSDLFRFALISFNLF